VDTDIDLVAANGTGIRLFRTVQVKVTRIALANVSITLGAGSVSQLGDRILEKLNA